MTRGRQRFLFTIEGRRYALGLEAVERVVQAVAVTPLSDGPEVVLGVINLQGRIVPVLDIRRRLGLPAREISLDDHLVIAHADSHAVAFFADSVEGVVDEPEGAVTDGNDIVPGLEFVQGVMRLDEGLVLIQNLERMWSAEDRHRLTDVLGEATANG